MSPITRSIYNHLRGMVEKSVEKNGLDGVHARTIPVQFVFAEELGLHVDSYRRKFEKNKVKNPGSIFCIMVSELDYVNAIEKYGQDRWGIEPFDFESNDDDDDDDIEVDLDDDDDIDEPEVTTDSGE